jgi:hypothetical protein
MLHRYEVAMESTRYGHTFYTDVGRIFPKDAGTGSKLAGISLDDAGSSSV